MKKIYIGIFIIFNLLYSENQFIPLYIGSQKIIVEVVSSPEMRMKGLMFRKSIPDDYGMLFVFDSEEIQGMWMKNTWIHLDIIFLDKERQVIEIFENVPPCRTEPCYSYVSKRPAKYALELKGNRSKDLNLKTGDSIFFIIDQNN